MAYTWGGTTLNIVPFSYKPWHSENGLVEIDILPDGTTNPAVILQQMGRRRKVVSFEGFTTSYSNYTGLFDDYIALTERTFVDPNDSMTMIISNISPATMIIDGKWIYRITFMEA